ncbi:ureidoglycolate hydrolase [Podospora conica]|nr:ureidoglycolate hydrolase [Schizothecium conicum]
MASPVTLSLSGPAIAVDATPLAADAFSAFGDVVENPRPDLHPSPSSATTSLPFDAIVANQGSAIKYQHVTRMVNLYDQAPSRLPGVAVVNMFVCAARLPLDGTGTAPRAFPVTVLERHPYTAQTFIPLTADPAKRYLVVVAPSLPPSPADERLPVPTTPGPFRPLPGRGLPDLRRLRAFVATGKQAVTYAAGTWHAPMVALGDAGTAMDFVVVQFANGVAVEDCQEVYLGPSSSGPTSPSGTGTILVKLPPGPTLAKL